ncbi:hypothetical protein ETB97_010952 [Aspergillus alliaceus]|uniref:Uncharacterized protein n=1 Tax=Petromyces alliaceus TaxID=209559 RepID=A0A8H6A9C0_PETAA|nr:hypothetical protein ETB97_010952 [Aspergillus burnettii]
MELPTHGRASAFAATRQQEPLEQDILLCVDINKKSTILATGTERLPLVPNAIDLQLTGEITVHFDPRHDPRMFHLLKWDQHLRETFPMLRESGFDGRILILWLDYLPPKPWPKRVAGFPCYLTTDLEDYGPVEPIFRCPQPPGRHACTNFDYTFDETKFPALFDLIKGFFQYFKIPITEVQYWGHIVVIVLGNAMQRKNVIESLPRTFARCYCSYLYESEMSLPAILPSLPLEQLTPRAYDQDAPAPILRPGAKLSLSRHPKPGSGMLTSAGVLVRNSQGQLFMTASARGFASDGLKVYLPHSSGAEVGTLAAKRPGTDVALIKLNQNVHFVNTLFENAPFALTGFVRMAETPQRGQVFFNSPFSGLIEGARGVQSRFYIPSGNKFEPDGRWINCRWDYMGQGFSSQVVSGDCGSAVWDPNGKINGFVRYAPRSGLFRDWCMITAADHFIDGGFSLV